jgi:hypothetical protein
VLASSAAFCLTLGLAPGAGASVPGATGPTCTQVDGFVADLSGSLFRTVDTQPLTGVGTLTRGAKVGRGWKGSSFAWVGGGGDGVIYALTWSGDLKWFKYDSVNSSWDGAMGRVVATGFVPGKTMINIGLGKEGHFYVVRPNHDLVEYEHTGWATGAATWATPRGEKVGIGWTDDEILVPVGDGSLYRQYRGTLTWYRHSNPSDGPVTWTKKVVGSGWKFYDIRSAGAGVLYTTSVRDGSVRMYQHLDPSGGSVAWAASTGLAKGEIDDPDSLGLMVDPASCRLPG